MYRSIVSHGNSHQSHTAPNITLRPDFLNFHQWKCLLTFYLRETPFAWEVVTGRLKLPSNENVTQLTTEEKEQKANYIIGNQGALALIVESLDPNICITYVNGGFNQTSAEDLWNLIGTRLYEETILKLIQTETTRRQDAKQSKKTCWNCGEIGHKSKRCRKRRQKVRTRKSATNPSPNVKCWVCGKLGHVRQNCRKKKQANKENQENQEQTLQRGRETGTQWD